MKKPLSKSLLFEFKNMFVNYTQQLWFYEYKTTNFYVFSVCYGNESIWFHSRFYSLDEAKSVFFNYFRDLKSKKSND